MSASNRYMTQPVRTSFQYTDLNRYTPSLGIMSEADGMNGNMGNGSGPLSSNIQIVPVFSGVNYNHPNYNSLTGKSSSYAPYDRVNSAYLSKDCVKYVTQQVGVQSQSGEMMTPTPYPGM